MKATEYLRSVMRLGPEKQLSPPAVEPLAPGMRWQGSRGWGHNNPNRGLETAAPKVDACGVLSASIPMGGVLEFKKSCFNCAKSDIRMTKWITIENYKELHCTQFRFATAKMNEPEKMDISAATWARNCRHYVPDFQQ